MCVHGSQAVHCTTELYLSADRLKRRKKHKERTMLVYRGNVVVYILSTVKTENTYTTAQLEALVQKLSVVIIPQPLSFVPLVPIVPSVPSRIRSPSSFASNCARNPSRCFVKRSAVLFFVSTRLTDRRFFSRTHCCIAKHRISMCLSPPSPLRCCMCLAQSESISRCTAPS